MKPILLIGSAECWEKDLEEAKEIISEFDVMSVGDSCLYYKEIKFFVTYHPVDIKGYRLQRIKFGGNLDYRVISHKLKTGVDIVENHVAPSGSSALLGAAAAIRMGYKKVILCGCPMIGKVGGGYQPYDSFQKGWIARYNEIKSYVRSMSGFTANLLKRPDIWWLSE